jgi:hypothetical protein
MKVAFVGASGYGNVGDDTYPILWRRFFPQLEARFYNSDLPDGGLDDDTALVVFAGGGLMWHREGDAHLEYMSYYTTEAQRIGIPFGFISCDFQFRRDPDDLKKFVTDQTIEAWLPQLRLAKFIQLRSRESVDLLANHDVAASYAPDLAYLLRPINTVKSQDLITVIPAAQVRLSNESIVQDIHSAQEQHPDSPLLFLNMGGPVTDAEVQQFGSEFSADIILSDQIDPTRALDIIGRSHLVLTGRYHGMVLARNCGTPYRTYPHSQYKISVEPALEDAGDAWQNVITLSRVLRELGA